MGLIKSIFSAGRGVLADQWVDYLKCEPMSNDVLARKGYRVVGSGSSNTKGSDNVISNGSRVDVADGQFMMIVENGKIVDYCAEPGQYLYKTDLQPSLMGGGFGDLGKSFAEVGKRFLGGGQVMGTQRVYFVNTQEILGNKWGVGEVPFRDSEFSFSIKISSYGEYSYKITNPLMFYTNLCSTKLDAGDFTRDMIDSQLKAEVQSAMHPALGRVALKRIPYDQLPLFTKDICEEVNKELSADWEEARGISVFSFAVGGVTPDEASAKKIEQFQESRVYTDARMMGARLGTAQATAMENAASNEAGAMTGFMGMGFAQQAGGMNAAQFYQMNNQQPNAPAPAAPAAEPVRGWTCACGAVNQGNFCANCGAKKPADAPLYHCDKCGWTPEDPAHPPKFCPNCGDPFNDEDKQ